MKGAKRDERGLFCTRELACVPSTKKDETRNHLAENITIKNSHKNETKNGSEPGSREKKQSLRNAQMQRIYKK